MEPSFGTVKDTVIEKIPPAPGEETGTGGPAQAERDFLANALELAPFIKNLLGEEVGVYVSDLERYIYCAPGSVSLSLRPGDYIRQRDGSGPAQWPKGRYQGGKGSVRNSLHRYGLSH